MPWDRARDKIPDGERQAVQDKPVFKNDKDRPLTAHSFKRTLFVSNDGKIRFMPCTTASMGNIVTGYSLEEWTCLNFGECAYLLGAWNLIARIKQWNG
jgi:hypothetical protein